ncbi:hypothetical protein D3C85_1849390 [compost metagenome]
MDCAVLPVVLAYALDTLFTVSSNSTVTSFKSLDLTPTTLGAAVSTVAVNLVSTGTIARPE